MASLFTMSTATICGIGTDGVTQVIALVESYVAAESPATFQSMSVNSACACEAKMAKHKKANFILLIIAKHP